jgi:hypothetical protein
MQVDAAVAPGICGLPWARSEHLLTGKIIEADPHAAEEQAKIWEAERFVRAGRTNQHGLKLLIAKANAGDVILFMATVNRIAEILKLQGDMASADVRRSKAFLAQPAVAAQLLWDCRNEQRPAGEPQLPDEPIHNDPEAPYDHSTTPPDDLLNDETEDLPGNESSGRREEATDPPASPAEASGSLDPDGRPADSSYPAESPEPASRGLIMQPSPVDVRRLRPQVILHIHLSEEALLSYHSDTSRKGGGVARMEGVGPVTLGQVRRFLADTGGDIKVQPVIDPEAMFLRMPASCFPTPPPSGVWSWTTPSPIHHQPGRAAGPDRRLQSAIRAEQSTSARSRPVHPVRAPHQNPWPLAGATTRTRGVDLAITSRRALPGQQHRHPQPRQRSLRPPHLEDRDSSQRAASTVAAGWVISNGRVAARRSAEMMATWLPMSPFFGESTSGRTTRSPCRRCARWLRMLDTPTSRRTSTAAT